MITLPTFPPCAREGLLIRGSDRPKASQNSTVFYVTEQDTFLLHSILDLLPTLSFMTATWRIG